MTIKHPREHCLVVARGAAVDPTTILGGSAGQVLTQVTAGADPAFAAPATVNLTSGVTGVLPIANGGTGHAAGAIAIMQFSGTAVAAGVTTRLGRDDSTTEVDVAYISPVTGTIIRIDTLASTAPVGTETFSYRPRVNTNSVGVNQTVTGAAQTTTSGAIAVAVTAGQLICCQLITSAGAAVADHMATFAILVTA
jgi:hypothetical protein